MRPFLSCHRCKVDGFVITRCSKSKVHFCMKNNQGCSNFFFNKNSKSVMSKPHFLSSVMFKIFHALWKIENSLDFFSCNCFASLMLPCLTQEFLRERYRTRLCYVMIGKIRRHGVLMHLLLFFLRSIRMRKLIDRKFSWERFSTRCILNSENEMMLWNIKTCLISFQCEDAFLKGKMTNQ